MKPAVPITDKRFAYIPAKEHAGNADDFRERQRKRMAAAGWPMPKTTAVVQSLQRKS